jgi:nitroreductase
MNPAEVIFKRRSIRKFTGEPVSDETVKSILEAAMAAPSACAKDPWHFIVIREKEILKRVAEGLPNGQFLPSAAVGLIVCGDINKAHGNELSYMLQDCSAAIENTLLAVDMLGLGACWLGVHPRTDRIQHLKTLFGLPQNIIPISVIAIGCPAESRPPRTRFNPELVHYETF